MDHSYVISRVLIQEREESIDTKVVPVKVLPRLIRHKIRCVPIVFFYGLKIFTES